MLLIWAGFTYLILAYLISLVIDELKPELTTNQAIAFLAGQGLFGMSWFYILGAI